MMVVFKIRDSVYTDRIYLARDIPAFVMYCVYGESRSSLLIEFTDSMILFTYLLLGIKTISYFFQVLEVDFFKCFIYAILCAPHLILIAFWHDPY